MAEKIFTRLSGRPLLKGEKTMKIGKLLKKTREERELTKKDAAEQIGIHPVSLAKIENGVTDGSRAKDRIMAWILPRKTKAKPKRKYVKQPVITMEKTKIEPGAKIKTKAPSVEAEIGHLKQGELAGASIEALVTARDRIAASMAYQSETLSFINGAIERIRDLVK